MCSTAPAGVVVWFAFKKHNPCTLVTEHHTSSMCLVGTTPCELQMWPARQLLDARVNISTARMLGNACSVAFLAALSTRKLTCMLVLCGIHLATVIAPGEVLPDKSKDLYPTMHNVDMRGNAQIHWCW